jgi:uncharacterized SAM-binding protein YcdF (DUF218 family)
MMLTLVVFLFVCPLFLCFCTEFLRWIFVLRWKEAYSFSLSAFSCGLLVATWLGVRFYNPRAGRYMEGDSQLEMSVILAVLSFAFGLVLFVARKVLSSPKKEDRS